MQNSSGTRIGAPSAAQTPDETGGVDDVDGMYYATGFYYDIELAYYIELPLYYSNLSYFWATSLGFARIPTRRDLEIFRRQSGHERVTRGTLLRRTGP